MYIVSKDITNWLHFYLINIICENILSHQYGKKIHIKFWCNRNSSHKNHMWFYWPCFEWINPWLLKKEEMYVPYHKNYTIWDAIIKMEVLRVPFPCILRSWSIIKETGWIRTSILKCMHSNVTVKTSALWANTWGNELRICSSLIPPRPSVKLPRPHAR